MLHPLVRVLPLVHGPDSPSGGILSSISFPTSSLQIMTMPTPFSSSFLSGLRMIGSCLFAAKYPKISKVCTRSPPTITTNVVFRALLSHRMFHSFRDSSTLEPRRRSPPGCRYILHPY